MSEKFLYQPLTDEEAEKLGGGRKKRCGHGTTDTTVIVTNVLAVIPQAGNNRRGTQPFHL